MEVVEAEVSPAGAIQPLGHGEPILIVDDCRLRREYLVNELVGHGIVVAASWDLASFQAASEEHPLRVVLVHTSTRDSKLILNRIVDAGLASRLVVFGLTQDDEDSIVSLAEAGVVGYHLRSESLEELLAFIGRVADGGSGCSSGVSAILLRRLSRMAAERGNSEAGLLTSRESEILQMLELGLSNQEIADRLHIARDTVKNHVHNVLNKLGARSRAEAAAIARNGIAETEARGLKANHNRS